MVKIFLTIILIGLFFHTSFQLDDNNELNANSPRFLESTTTSTTTDCVEQKYKVICIMLDCYWFDNAGCMSKENVSCTDSLNSLYCSTLHHCYWDDESQICKSIAEVDCGGITSPVQCFKFQKCLWDSVRLKCLEKEFVKCAELNPVDCIKLEKCYVSLIDQQCKDQSTEICERLMHFDCFNVSHCKWNIFKSTCITRENFGTKNL